MTAPLPPPPARKDEPIRVLLVTGSFPPMRCGVGDYTWKLAAALVDLGMKVGVLTGEGADAERAPPDVTVFPVMPHWHLSALGRVMKTMRAWRPDIVHVQYPTQGYGIGAVLPSLVPILARTTGARAARTWHEIPSGREKSFLLQAMASGDYVVTRHEFEALLPTTAKWLLRRSRRYHIPIASNIPIVELSPDERMSMRARYLQNDERHRQVIVYFGFLYRFKGADQLFDVCDPATDHLVFVGETTVDPGYTADLEARANQSPWCGHVSFPGYLPEEDIARHLAMADAVVLPFRRGGGVGNGTIHAAVLQGAPVVTTSRDHLGWDEAQNVDYSAPDDIAAMRKALNRLAGSRRPVDTDADRKQWRQIADAHRRLYEQAWPGKVR